MNPHTSQKICLVLYKTLCNIVQGNKDKKGTFQQMFCVYTKPGLESEKCSVQARQVSQKNSAPAGTTFHLFFFPLENNILFVTQFVILVLDMRHWQKTWSFSLLLFFNHRKSINSDPLGNMHHHSHYSKSQIFVQKFNFDKTPTFSRVYHPNKIDHFLGKSKLNFWTKNGDFEQCVTGD